MSATECAKQLVDQVVDILAQHGVEMDKIFAAQDDLLKVSTVWFNKFGKLEKELDDQKVLTNKLLQKVCTLERKLKDCIIMTADVNSTTSGQMSSAAQKRPCRRSKSS